MSKVNDATDKALLCIDGSPYLRRTVKGLAKHYTLDEVAEMLLGLIQWFGSEVNSQSALEELLYMIVKREKSYYLSEEQFKLSLIGYDKCKYQTIFEELEQYRHWIVRHGKTPLDIPEFLTGLLSSLDTIDEINSGNTCISTGVKNVLSILDNEDVDLSHVCETIVFAS